MKLLLSLDTFGDFTVLIRRQSVVTTGTGDLLPIFLLEFGVEMAAPTREAYQVAARAGTLVWPLWESIGAKALAANGAFFVVHDPLSLCLWLHGILLRLDLGLGSVVLLL